jgi:putative tryptophan/tyrosine transport system substrate-binding protein
MKRREFITLIGGAAAWPLTVRSQSAVPVIGLVGTAAASEWKPYVDAFYRGLGEVGYVERRNVAIEARWANGQYERLPAMAADLIQRQTTVIVALSTPAARAAKAATATIPVVFTTISDPVQMGLVASLNRPGGNVTGVTNLSAEVGPKLLELLREAVPTAKIIALLVNPTNPTAETLSKSLQTAARASGLQLHVLNASTEKELNSVFMTLRQLQAEGLVVVSDVFLTTQSEQLAALTVRHAMPAIFQDRQFASAGGLMTYGGSITDMYRQAGVYTGRILKGEKPADLPVVQATKLELTINLKTAKALGLNIPNSLIGRADELIE